MLLRFWKVASWQSVLPFVPRQNYWEAWHSVNRTRYWELLLFNYSYPGRVTSFCLKKPSRFARTKDCHLQTCHGCCRPLSLLSIRRSSFLFFRWRKTENILKRDKVRWCCFLARLGTVFSAFLMFVIGAQRVGTARGGRNSKTGVINDCSGCWIQNKTTMCYHARKNEQEERVVGRGGAWIRVRGR